jgi:hypothetical protein
VITRADASVTIALVLSFALLVTTHVATLFALWRRGPARTALAATVVPPVAPIVALAWGLRVRPALWAASAAVYVTALLLAR